jgi:hypothetical protein
MEGHPLTDSQPLQVRKDGHLLIAGRPVDCVVEIEKMRGQQRAILSGYSENERPFGHNKLTPEPWIAPL